MKKALLFLSSICVSFMMQSQSGPPIMLGATEYGGAAHSGAIVTYISGDTVYKEYSFPSDPHATGSYFQHLTQAPNGKFYGLTGAPGHANVGYLFEYDYLTDGYTTKVTFDSATGDYGLTSLFLSKNGVMYSVATYGDSTNGGTIYSYVPGDTFVTKLVTLPVNASPSTTLAEADTGVMYGMTYTDGTNGSGTIFEYNANTNAFSELVNLPTNADPIGRLLRVGRDTFYAATNSDGINNSGTFIRYIAGQTTDDVLFDFPPGAAPSSAPSLGPDGLIYGLTYEDGTFGNGTIYSVNRYTSAYTVVYNFGDSVMDGDNPQGGMVLATDSIFYGMTNQGGVTGSGAIFTFDPIRGFYNKVADLSTATGDRPAFGDMVQYIAPPVITTTPGALTVCPGTTATFSVVAVGLDLKYQWQLSVDGGATYNDLSGATTSSFSITAQTFYSGAMGRVLVSNPGGIDTTVAVALTVTQISDSVSSSDPVVTAFQTVATYQWLDCAAGVITGATAQSYTATQTGNYSCIVTVGSCTDTTACTTVVVGGIHTISDYSFSVSPNPTSGTVTISNNYTGKLNIQITSLIGSELMNVETQGGQSTLDMSTLAAGVYLIHISDDTHTLRTLKIVRE